MHVNQRGKLRTRASMLRVNTSLTLLMMTHQKVNDQLRRIKAIDYIQVKQEKFTAGYRLNLYHVSIGSNTETILMNSTIAHHSHNYM